MPLHGLVCLLWAGLLSCLSTTANTLYINYSDQVPPGDLLAFDTCILSPENRTALPEDAPAQTFLGYLSVVEIAGDASYRQAALDAGVQPLGNNTTWNSTLVNPAQSEWQRFVLETLAPKIIERGYDGFFLDTAESVEYLAEHTPTQREQYYQGLKELVISLREQYPQAKIVINRGFSVLPDLYDTVDGVLVESLFRAYDYDKEVYTESSENDQAWLLERLHPAREAGLSVYVADFLPRTEATLARETVARIREEGFIPLITEPDLMGKIVAPLSRKPRHWLALYGGIPTDDFRDYPEDTDTMALMQLPFEYYGYEVEYINPHESGGLPEPDLQTAGVLVDSSLELTASMQAAFADWLIALKRSGRKVVFIGSLPDLLPSQAQKLAQELGLGGTLQPLGDIKRVELIEKNKRLMDDEAPVVIDQQSATNIQAPQDAEVYLRLGVHLQTGETVTNTPVFTCAWGGAALSPYLMRLNPEGNPMLLTDAFAFVREATDSPQFPAPDVTTRQGARIYFSHIDGDGFLNFSQLKPGARSGMIILERIIEAFGLPITASIIESEINGDSSVYEPREDEDFEALARELFAHPLVEPASHTYSHPFFWSYDDITSRNYPAQNVNIRAEYNYGTIRYPREITESVAYINDKLLPEGERTNLILWSGNCRLPPEALALASEHNIINMNGGNTTITRRAPFQSLISPKRVRWGEQTQVYCAVQNENIFNNALNNGRFGGFVNVLQTFEMTEHPRRLKPVNVYYHFYSADRFDAFTALRRVMQWVSEQPLHPMHATDYIRTVLDSSEAAIYQNDDGAFVITNQGTLQTVRIPISMGYPDLSRSTGVLGFYDLADERYIHILPNQRVTLALTSQAPTMPYLHQARALVTKAALVANDNTLEIHAQNPASFSLPATWAGLPPASQWQENDSGRIHKVDTEGRLTFGIPPGEHRLSIIKKKP